MNRTSRKTQKKVGKLKIWEKGWRIQEMVRKKGEGNVRKIKDQVVRKIEELFLYLILVAKNEW